MKIKISPKDFDDRQRRLLRELVRQVRATLHASDVPRATVRDATQNIVFAVSSLIDACAPITHKRKPFRPFLTFADDPSNNELIAAPDGSFLHEYASAAVDALFERDGDDSSTDYTSAILAYCAQHAITVPPGFHRRGHAFRYAVVRLHVTPHKLVAVTWGNHDELRSYFQSVIEPEFAAFKGDGPFVRVLDFETRSLLCPVQGWYFAPSLSIE